VALRGRLAHPGTAARLAMGLTSVRRQLASTANRQSTVRKRRVRDPRRSGRAMAAMDDAGTGIHRILMLAADRCLHKEFLNGSWRQPLQSAVEDHTAAL
jgi:hypothetical protein